MKLANIKHIEQIKSIKSINGTLRTNKIVRSPYLDSVELISYSMDLIYYCNNILKNDIVVKNKNEIMNRIQNEIITVTNILDDFKNINVNDYSYTQKYKRDFYKSIGLTKKYL